MSNQTATSVYEDIFRINSLLRPLTTERLDYIKQLKAKAQELFEMVMHTKEASDPRCLSLFKTNLEQAVMWMTKGLT